MTEKWKSAKKNKKTIHTKTRPWKTELNTDVVLKRDETVLNFSTLFQAEFRIEINFLIFFGESNL
ncbi:hypothetical protein CH370_12570 [Leptospira kmetyi]|uniref:Uncharacterized protein n=1 Tax=Leptospira kmetyi TaxID=408139 RepID=A0AAD0UTS8_9LEPT|nr:hypothetical protein EFP84_10965 [Leptospira kmetyi]PJZ41075.1 hypothetical protein CH370_12570 [Leptospira kmetyi]